MNEVIEIIRMIGTHEIILIGSIVVIGIVVIAQWILIIGAIKKIWDTSKNASRWRWFASGAWLIFFIVGGVFVLYPYGNAFFEDDVAGNLEAIRNIVLIMAALLAFPLALERMIIAEKQLEATQDQLKQSKTEAKQAREEFKEQKREDNFARWQESLFSTNRILQSYAVAQLWRIAQYRSQYDYRCHYHLRVMKSLSDFLEITKNIDSNDQNAEAAIMALKILTNLDNRYEKTSGQEEEEIRYQYYTRLRSLEIRGIDLTGASFSGFILDKVLFNGVDLTRARFQFSDLSEVQFEECYLMHAKFNRCLFANNTTFKKSDLAEAHFNGNFLQSVTFDTDTNLTEASWENISIPQKFVNITPNIHKEKMVMQNAEIKSLDEWLKERKKELGET